MKCPKVEKSKYMIASNFGPVIVYYFQRIETKGTLRRYHN